MATLQELFKRAKMIGIDESDIIEKYFEGDDGLEEIFGHERDCKGFSITYRYFSHYRRGGIKSECVNCEWILKVKTNIKTVINLRENYLAIGYMRQNTKDLNTNTCNFPEAIKLIIYGYYTKRID